MRSKVLVQSARNLMREIFLFDTGLVMTNTKSFNKKTFTIKKVKTEIWCILPHPPPLQKNNNKSYFTQILLVLISINLPFWTCYCFLTQSLYIKLDKFIFMMTCWIKFYNIHKYYIRIKHFLWGWGWLFATCYFSYCSWSI